MMLPASAPSSLLSLSAGKSIQSRHHMQDATLRQCKCVEFDELSVVDVKISLGLRE